MDRKALIMQGLAAFVAQRPGLEFGNYGDATIYRREMRQITRDRHDAERLMGAVGWRDSITADDIIAASKSAYSGRLTIVESDDPKRRVRIEYCTGQYFPTEYRRAVCAVMAAALWTRTREHCMPTDDRVREVPGEWGPKTQYREGSHWVSAGDYIRNSFRREYGARLQRRWFD